MKTRRSLHNLDVARIAPLNSEQKRNALRQIKEGWPPYSYDPFRDSSLEIMNIAAGPLAPVPRRPWEVIASDIARRCRGNDDAVAANQRAGEGLYRFTDEFNLVGRKHEFYPLLIGLATKLSYWSPAVIEIGGRPYVPFIDPRRTKTLSSDARRFVFSAQHERIRAADPDFSDIGFVIIQFENSVAGLRKVVTHYEDSRPLWSYQDLDEMVRETYEIWYQVLDEREDEARRSVVGIGPLFDR